MNYSISDASKQTGLEAYTIRFYEKEGIILPGRSRNGNRFFTEQDMARLSFICCLKKAGMTISEMKVYFDLAEKGDSTLETRLEMFRERRRHVIDELKELESHLETVEWKINFYEKQLAERNAIDKVC